MQTFLPYSDNTKTAFCLDDKRLGNQRNEVLGIVRALMGENEGYQNHPAVKMWQGYEQSLVEYGKCICNEWLQRGYNDSVLEQLERYESKEKPIAPPWWGGVVHASHKACLLRKDFDWYSQYGWQVSLRIPLYWPIDPEDPRYDTAKAWESVKHLVIKQVQKFHSRFGGDWVDCMGEGHRIFTESLVTYDPTKSTFAKRIAFNVQIGLLDWLRSRQTRDKHLHIEDTELGDVARNHAGFSVSSFCHQVSPDASLMLRLALDPPQEVLYEVKKKSKKNSPQVLLDALVDFMRDLGWATKRVLECVDEIREALR